MISKKWLGFFIATVLSSYDLETWKTNPPPLRLDNFPSISEIYSYPNVAEPFDPPFLPSSKNSKNSYLEGVLPQILPPLFLPPAPLPLEIVSQPEKIEFIISYQLYTKDGIAKGERYSISEPIKSRVHSPKYKFDYKCSINTYVGDFLLDDDKDESYVLKLILEAKKDSVLECLYKSGVKVVDNSFTSSFQTTTKTTLSLPARSIEAYFDNNFLIIEVYKERR